MALQRVKRIRANSPKGKRATVTSAVYVAPTASRQRRRRSLRKLPSGYVRSARRNSQTNKRNERTKKLNTRSRAKSDDYRTILPLRENSESELLREWITEKPTRVTRILKPAKTNPCFRAGSAHTRGFYLKDLQSIARVNNMNVPANVYGAHARRRAGAPDERRKA